MTKKSSFTDKERAAWHDDRRHKSQGDADAGMSSVSGTPLGRDILGGYEAALCDACD